MSNETKPMETARTEAPTTNGNMLAVIDRAARDTNVDVGKMERLLALAQQIHERDARAAYDSAMSTAQGEMRSISRNCHNPQTRSRYASYEAIDNAIRPIYTAHGFAMSFGAKSATTADKVIATCRISHRAGHNEHVELEMPADGKGPQGNSVMTRTHATGSALSYAKRYIANLVWNLSFGEADDDGNAAGETTKTTKPVTPPPSRPTPPPAQEGGPGSGGLPAPSPKPQTTAVDVLPKAATEATRKWMLDNLNHLDAEAVWNYAVAKNFINEKETLDAWYLEHVPTSKSALDALIRDIEATIPKTIGEEQESNGLPEDLRAEIITVPRAGMKRGEYIQNPDTIGGLYDAMKSGDTDAQKRLYGMANDWQPQPWVNNQGVKMPPNSADLKCRAALDRFLELKGK